MTRLQEEMRQAAVSLLDEAYPTWVKRHDVPASAFDRVTIDFEKQAQDLADATYALVEPLLREVVAASKAHPFLPDLKRAIARVEAALEQP